jgi:pimeloyl-ACP methyl ester carboxylesterase
MRELTTPRGIRVAYSKSGSGPPLVLVHGGFSDHHSNWEFVEPILRDRFTLYAMARRNRGGTTATQGHSVVDEAHDVVALMQHVGERVFLLGHSYGAQCALSAALLFPHGVKKLVLYEPPRPSAFPPDAFASLERLAASEAWDAFAFTFFRDTIGVPIGELEPLRASGLWAPIVADAQASWGDICALRSHQFRAEAHRGLSMPVCLQIGSESRHDLYVTDALAAELPDAHLTVLHGQAHEGMTTAPEQYAAAVSAFLLG